MRRKQNVASVLGIHKENGGGGGGGVTMHFSEIIKVTWAKMPYIAF